MLQSTGRFMTSEARKINNAGRIPSEQILPIFKQRHTAFQLGEQTALPRGGSGEGPAAPAGCVGLIRDLLGLQRDPGAPGPVWGQEQSESIAPSVRSRRAPGGRVGFFDLF